MDLLDHLSLAAAVGAIKDSTITLCSKISGHLATSKVPQGSRHLRALVTELRLFGGALYSLETLALELESANEQPKVTTALSLLCQFGLLLHSLDERFRHLSHESILGYREKVRTSRSRVAYVLAESHNLQDCLLLLSALGEGEETSMGADPDRVAAWLDVINSPYNDREPRDFYLEKLLLEDRGTELPEYSTAATTWPLYAEQYWTTLAQKVKDLFVLPPSNRFVHWALEYARQSWPRQLGSDRPNPDAIIDLADALCDGSASPLHIAAALGLPSLCRSLLSDGADVCHAGRLGTPLYCALVGPTVLFVGDLLESWQCVLTDGQEVKSRRSTLLKILDAGSDCEYEFRWKDGRTGSLAGLAFWAACVVDDYSIFERVLSGGAVLDDSFAHFLAHPVFADSARPRAATLALLLTCAFDSTFDCAYEYPWYREDFVIDEIEHVMHDRGLTFADGLGRGRKLDRVSDQAFSTLVSGAILDEEPSYFRRLAMDSRFDPNLRVGQNEEQGTLFHSAVGRDQMEMVDLLVAAGADSATKDDQGRTPLLVVESTHMLARLVYHGLSTTDSDDKGRNIWHYAAATNDSVLLDWLCANDPSKEENMTAVTDSGCTPLDEALGYVDTLREMEKSHGRAAEPIAARIMLTAGASGASSCSTPPFHLAVAWGEVSLLEDLLAAGADARSIDKRGQTALHHLNLSAAPELVVLVQDLCRGLPIGSTDGLTPADTILINTAFLYDDSCFVPSEHPSCRGTLSTDAYALLLTEETLKYRDASGRGPWARFCHRVLPRLDHIASRGGCREMSFYHSSLATALQCLLRCGALASYEEDTGRCAAFCLATDRAGCTDWKPSRFSFVRYILEHSDSSLLGQFVRSDVAAELLASVRARRDLDLESLLVSKGVHPPSKSLDGT